MLLDYLSTHLGAVIRYKSSDTRLHIDTDAAFLVAPGAKSRFAGYFHLVSDVTKSSPASTQENPGIHVEYKLLKHVVS